VTRRRLQPQQRREQLLDIGAALFAEKPYKDVLLKEIVARAGVSRHLLYHYFPSKRDLYIAIFERASDRFLARVSPNPQLPLAERLVIGLEAQIQSFVDHPLKQSRSTVAHCRMTRQSRRSSPQSPTSWASARPINSSRRDVRATSPRSP
jgi:AcrR family transcriptional regulator